MPVDGGGAGRKPAGGGRGGFDLGAAPPPPPTGGRGGDLPEIDPANAVAIPDERIDYTPEWGERVDAIRLEDSLTGAPALVVMLGRDDRLVRLVASWPACRLPFESAMPVPPPDDMPDQEVLGRCWAKLWNPGNQHQNREATPNMIANTSGLTAAEVQVVLRIGIQTRLLYPNGKIHVAAERFLRAEAVATLLSRVSALAARGGKK